MNTCHYEKLNNNEEESALTGEYGPQLGSPIPRRIPSKVAICLLGALAFLLVASTSIAILANQIIGLHPNWLLVKANSYSPLFKYLRFSFRDVMTNGSLFNDPYIIYRAPPSEQVDAAWDAIADVIPFPVSEEEIRKIGKDPAQAVRVPEEWGYGSNQYLVQLDVQHLIHCLDALRKYSHYDYYYRDKWGGQGNMPVLHVAHRSHCIGALLEALTCQPSVNLITFDWMETQHNPFPDFNIRRKCQNHDEILKWKKSVDIKGYEGLVANISKPNGAKILPVLKQIAESPD